MNSRRRHDPNPAGPSLKEQQQYRIWNPTTDKHVEPTYDRPRRTAAAAEAANQQYIARGYSSDSRLTSAPGASTSTRLPTNRAPSATPASSSGGHAPRAPTSSTASHTPAPAQSQHSYSYSAAQSANAEAYRLRDYLKKKRDAVAEKDKEAARPVPEQPQRLDDIRQRSRSTAPPQDYNPPTAVLSSSAQAYSSQNPSYAPDAPPPNAPRDLERERRREERHRARAVERERERYREEMEKVAASRPKESASVRQERDRTRDRSRDDRPREDVARDARAREDVVAREARVREDKMREDRARERARGERSRVREERAREEKAPEPLAQDGGVREDRAREQQLREERARDLQERAQQAREQQAREQQTREQQAREQQAREQQAREQQAREQQERAQQAREQQAREQQTREKQAREQQAREQQAREQQAREQQAREQQAREQQAREQQIREQQAREQQIREQQAREQQVHEQQAREQQIRDQQLERTREQQARERQVREQQARDQQAREQLERMREQQAQDQLERAREQQVQEQLEQAREQQVREQRERAREQRERAREQQAQEQLDRAREQQAREQLERVREQQAREQLERVREQQAREQLERDREQRALEERQRSERIAEERARMEKARDDALRAERAMAERAREGKAKDDRAREEKTREQRQRDERRREEKARLIEEQERRYREVEARRNMPHGRPRAPTVADSTKEHDSSDSSLRNPFTFARGHRRQRTEDGTSTTGQLRSHPASHQPSQSVSGAAGSLVPTAQGNAPQTFAGPIFAAGRSTPSQLAPSGQSATVGRSTPSQLATLAPERSRDPRENPIASSVYPSDHEKQPRRQPSRRDPHGGNSESETDRGTLRDRRRPSDPREITAVATGPRGLSTNDQNVPPGGTQAISAIPAPHVVHKQESKSSVAQWLQERALGAKTPKPQDMQSQRAIPSYTLQPNVSSAAVAEAPGDRSRPENLPLQIAKVPSKKAPVDPQPEEIVVRPQAELPIPPAAPIEHSDSRGFEPLRAPEMVPRPQTAAPAYGHREHSRNASGQAQMHNQRVAESLASLRGAGASQMAPLIRQPSAAGFQEAVVHGQNSRAHVQSMAPTGAAYPSVSREQQAPAQDRTQIQYGTTPTALADHRQDQTTRAPEMIPRPHTSASSHAGGGLSAGAPLSQDVVGLSLGLQGDLSQNLATALRPPDTEQAAALFQASASQQSITEMHLSARLVRQHESNIYSSTQRSVSGQDPVGVLQVPQTHGGGKASSFSHVPWIPNVVNITPPQLIASVPPTYLAVPQAVARVPSSAPSVKDAERMSTSQPPVSSMKAPATHTVNDHLSASANPATAAQLHGILTGPQRVPSGQGFPETRNAHRSGDTDVPVLHASWSQPDVQPDQPERIIVYQAQGLPQHGLEISSDVTRPTIPFVVVAPEAGVSHREHSTGSRMQYSSDAAPLSSSAVDNEATPAEDPRLAALLQGPSSQDPRTVRGGLLFAPAMGHQPSAESRASSLGVVAPLNASGRSEGFSRAQDAASLPFPNVVPKHPYGNGILPAVREASSGHTRSVSVAPDPSPSLLPREIPFVPNVLRQDPRPAVTEQSYAAPLSQFPAAKGTRGEGGPSPSGNPQSRTQMEPDFDVERPPHPSSSHAPVVDGELYPTRSVSVIDQPRERKASHRSVAPPGVPVNGGRSSSRQEAIVALHLAQQVDMHTTVTQMARDLPRPPRASAKPGDSDDSTSRMPRQDLDNDPRSAMWIPPASVPRNPSSNGAHGHERREYVTISGQSKVVTMVTSGHAEALRHQPVISAPQVVQEASQSSQSATAQTRSVPAVPAQVTPSRAPTVAGEPPIDDPARHEHAKAMQTLSASESIAQAYLLRKSSTAPGKPAETPLAEPDGFSHHQSAPITPSARFPSSREQSAAGREHVAARSAQEMDDVLANAASNGTASMAAPKPSPLTRPPQPIVHASSATTHASAHASADTRNSPSNQPAPIAQAWSSSHFSSNLVDVSGVQLRPITSQSSHTIQSSTALPAFPAISSSSTAPNRPSPPRRPSQVGSGQPLGSDGAEPISAIASMAPRRSSEDRGDSRFVGPPRHGNVTNVAPAAPTPSLLPPSVHISSVDTAAKHTSSELAWKGMRPSGGLTTHAAVSVLGRDGIVATSIQATVALKESGARFPLVEDAPSTPSTGRSVKLQTRQYHTPPMAPNVIHATESHASNAQPGHDSHHLTSETRGVEVRGSNEFNSTAPAPNRAPQPRSQPPQQPTRSSQLTQLANILDSQPLRPSGSSKRPEQFQPPDVQTTMQATHSSSATATVEPLRPQHLHPMTAANVTRSTNAAAQHGAALDAMLNAVAFTPSHDSSHYSSAAASLSPPGLTPSSSSQSAIPPAPIQLNAPSAQSMFQSQSHTQSVSASQMPSASYGMSGRVLPQSVMHHPPAASRHHPSVSLASSGIPPSAQPIPRPTPTRTQTEPPAKLTTSHAPSASTRTHTRLASDPTQSRRGDAAGQPSVPMSAPPTQQITPGQHLPPSETRARRPDGGGQASVVGPAHPAQYASQAPNPSPPEVRPRRMDTFAQATTLSATQPTQQVVQVQTQQPLDARSRGVDPPGQASTQIPAPLAQQTTQVPNPSPPDHHRPKRVDTPSQPVPQTEDPSPPEARSRRADLAGQAPGVPPMTAAPIQQGQNHSPPDARLRRVDTGGPGSGTPSAAQVPQAVQGHPPPDVLSRRTDSAGQGVHPMSTASAQPAARGQTPSPPDAHARHMAIAGQAPHAAAAAAAAPSVQPGARGQTPSPPDARLRRADISGPAAVPASAPPTQTSHPQPPSPPEVRSYSPVAPSISSQALPARSPSAPPGNSSQASLVEPRKKGNVFSRIFKPSKTMPKQENVLTRIVSDNTGGRRLTRQPTPTRAPEPIARPSTSAGKISSSASAAAVQAKSSAAASVSSHPTTRADVPAPTAAPPAKVDVSAPPARATVSSSNAIHASSSAPTPASAPAPSSTSRPDVRSRPSERRMSRVPATLTIPVSQGPSTEKRSPNSAKPFFNLRYLTTKRHRTVSAASLEALDGTHHTLQTSTSVSTLSTMFNPVPPNLTPRDPLLAAQEWRNNEEAAARGRQAERRRRPGVTFDVDEDPPDNEMEQKVTLSRASSRLRRRRRPSNEGRSGSGDDERVAEGGRASSRERDRDRDRDRPSNESRPSAEGRSSAEGRPSVQDRPPTEYRPSVQDRPPTEYRPSAESRPSAEHRPSAESRVTSDRN